MKKIIISILTIIIIAIFSILGFKDADIMNENVVSNTNTTLNESTIDPSTFQEAYVKRIVDGDTIVVTIDGKDYKVRFIGINTPESTTEIEPYGKEATKYTSSMLMGKTIYLEKDVRNTDKYDRLLRYVWLEIPTEISNEEIRAKMFNAILLENGYAKLFTYPPDVKYAKYLEPLEAEARNNSSGLWGL